VVMPSMLLAADLKQAACSVLVLGGLPVGTPKIATFGEQLIPPAKSLLPAKLVVHNLSPSSA
jgi:hypothetical protein